MYDLRNLTIDSTKPCLVLYLIDQSSSMSSQFGNGHHNKAIETANAVNETLFEIGVRCDEYDVTNNRSEIKNRFEIGVIGYGQSVKSGWEGGLEGKWIVSIKDVYNHSLGINNDQFPFWIRPHADGNTPMTRAFENAKRICIDWINWGNHKDCHPPIIINITDGEPTDSGYKHSELKNETTKIKSLGTNYGNVIILNIHISENLGDRVLFPSELNFKNPYAELLFEISSPLTHNMIRLAKQQGYNINDGARGYVFNGNANDLIKFLNIGTPK